MGRACTAKRNLATVLMIAAVFCFSVPLMTGCAKKEAIREESPIVQEKIPEPSMAPAEVKDREPEALPQPMQEPMETVKKEATAAPERASYEFADIHFDFDTYNLSPAARETLKRHGDWLMKNDDYTVRIEGHCDERGTVEYNLALGERRAQEAKKYLVELGVAEKRISTVSYGKERPLDPGHNEEAWAKNRRDHFSVGRTK